MKIAAVLIFLLSSVYAQADIITCNFTEPFLVATYSMTQSQLTIKDYSDNKVSVTKNVSFQIKGPGEFELWDNKKNVVMTLSLNGEGSDGMSDSIYPYSAKMSDMVGFANGGFGGCSSQFLKTKVEQN
jgi:uncharacterized membrane protein